MSFLLQDNPAKKLEYILQRTASGKTNKEVSQELGYKDVNGLYAFMKRQGMGWNAKRGLFVVKDEKQGQEPQEVEEENFIGKVARIISLFEKKIDGKEIAKTLRFSSYQEMADYMRSKGYLWDNEKQNYAKEVEKVEVKSSKGKRKEQKESTKGIKKINSDSMSEQRIHQCECLKKSKFYFCGKWHFKD